MSLAGPLAARERALRPGELAWVAVLPCALVVLAAIVVLGPPLGHALLRPGPGEVLWPPHVRYVFGAPEPVKHARFGIALLGPALLAAVVLAIRRRRIALRPGTARALVAASQLLTLAFVAAAVLGQNNWIFPFEPQPWVIFHAKTLVGALVLPLVFLAAVRSRRVIGLIARWVPDTRARRVACLLVAGCLTVCWLLTAINSEATMGNAAFTDLPPWAMADALAILDGRTPLVNFYALYGEVWAYVVAVPMYVLGATMTVFTIVMTSISGLSLLAVYSIFRRIVRSSLLALALYLPLLAIGFLVFPSLPERPSSSAQIFSVWPMRYAGPYLLAWLTARHIDGATPRRAWPLFFAAGLVVVNNLEFGLGAFLGTLVALLCAQPPRSWRAVRQLAGSVASGLLGALLLVTLVTLVRSGELPHPGFLLEYPRIYGTVGYTDLPMPTTGFHLAVYATFAAAIGLAAVRLVSGEQDRLLTSMLAWSGVFGLLAGSYFAGRSDIFKLLALFSVWCFALALLLVAAVRGLAARGWRRPGLPELLVLVGFAIAIAALHQLPAPWSQAARLSRTTATPLYAESGPTRFVAAHTTSGERVAILIEMGHRIARDAGIVNVAPYAYLEAMVTERQTLTMLDAVRREHAHKIFVPNRLMAPDHRRALTRAGFSQRASGSGVAEWSDAPAATR